MKNNNIEHIFWGVGWGGLTAGAAIGIETGISSWFGLGGGLISMLFSPVIEETLKYLPVLSKKISRFWFVLGTAFVFALIEFAVLYGKIIVQYGVPHLGLRIIPHFIFAGLFLLGAKKHFLSGYLLALLAHYIWNFLA